uniref:MARVEL domain-containing protein n=1 Tax=Chromera velia CCMP2878 TaxID=1169474 RepID=A0A0G4F3W0_9ALVE|eukprot:Cvel_14936.t1-p1 / transcript=Cvel_14936.t1 / gene=Cvel_14936 / organism=Chromera_velia_CCMP2878 / gene_product=hypothetical protein / transcript_product=hypothetical protein / location=Cvel_scaffold1083:41453-42226(-) / protein_length=258 / sequence_SO=supercontig / SO=protein_coding / is_pseudo=false
MMREVQLPQYPSHSFKGERGWSWFMICLAICNSLVFAISVYGLGVILYYLGSYSALYMTWGFWNTLLNVLLIAACMVVSFVVCFAVCCPDSCGRPCLPRVNSSNFWAHFSCLHGIYLTLLIIGLIIMGAKGLTAPSGGWTQAVSETSEAEKNAMTAFVVLSLIILALQLCCYCTATILGSKYSAQRRRAAKAARKTGYASDSDRTATTHPSVAFTTNRPQPPPQVPVVTPGPFHHPGSTQVPPAGPTSREADNPVTLV